MVIRLVFGRIVPFSSVDRYEHFGGTSYLVLMLVCTYRNMQHHRSKLVHKGFQYFAKCYCSSPAGRQIDTLT
jgi:hypothetical protein